MGKNNNPRREQRPKRKRGEPTRVVADLPAIIDRRPNKRRTKTRRHR